MAFFLEMLTIHYVSVADIFIAKIDVMLGIRLRALIAFNVVKLFSFETDASFKFFSQRNNSNYEKYYLDPAFAHHNAVKVWTAAQPRIYFFTPTENIFPQSLSCGAFGVLLIQNQGRAPTFRFQNRFQYALMFPHYSSSINYTMIFSDT